MDWLHVRLWTGGSWPDFNFADSFIVVGVAMLVFELFASEGVDVAAGIAEIVDRRDELKQILVAARKKHGFDADPIRGFVMPTLAALGLYTERIAPKYRNLIEENMISGFEGTTFDGSFKLPEDLEAWVDETSE